MPRPGTRPYECVRRAWHSERHQPIRGSLIKEIFRIAREIHSPSIKKKKEWQEKLPIVVLKADEIMYSKANSEDEYMDPKTVWERVNDAINTIIRRDQSDDETGEFLQPCIEASLNLGCIPRRASRSQRNSNPRFYLGSYSLGRGDGPLASQCPNFMSPAPLTCKIPVQNCDFGLLNAEFHSTSYSPYPPLESQPGFVTVTPKWRFANDKILETRIMHKASPFDKEPSTMISEVPPDELVCDLSLRLAPLSVSAPSTRKRRAMEVVDDQHFSWQPKLLCTYPSGSVTVGCKSRLNSSFEASSMMDRSQEPTFSFNPDIYR